MRAKCHMLEITQTVSFFDRIRSRIARNSTRHPSHDIAQSQILGPVEKILPLGTGTTYRKIRGNSGNLPSLSRFTAIQDFTVYDLYVILPVILFSAEFICHDLCATSFLASRSATRSLLSAKASSMTKPAIPPRDSVPSSCLRNFEPKTTFGSGKPGTLI